MSLYQISIFLVKLSTLKGLKGHRKMLFYAPLGLGLRYTIASLIECRKSLCLGLTVAKVDP